LEITVQTVLTATFNSYGNRQISTTTKSIPLNRSTKNSAQLITSTRGPLYQMSANPPTEKWVNYNKNSFYLYLFTRVCVQVRPVHGWIFTLDCSKDVKSRKNVPLWFY